MSCPHLYWTTRKADVIMTGLTIPTSPDARLLAKTTKELDSTISQTFLHSFCSRSWLQIPMLTRRVNKPIQRATNQTNIIFTSITVPAKPFIASLTLTANKCEVWVWITISIHSVSSRGEFELTMRRIITGIMLKSLILTTTGGF